jgi:hypothetical protein
MNPTLESLAVTRAEAELLLRTARVDLDEPARERILALLRDGLDWAWLLGAAEVHGTAPLLYWHLSRLAPADVPAAVMEDLRQRFLGNARNSLFLTGELLRLLGLFAAHGIRTVPFKGPTLAVYAYGNLALRQFSDLDLLVLPTELGRARELLAAEGYSSGLPLAPAQQEAHLAAIGHIPFVHEGRVCMVEPHARLAPRAFHFPLDLERLWPRLQPLSLNGREVQALAGEDLLLVLCFHGAKHVWTNLSWVCDVAELLRVQRAMNWEAVVSEARSLRCQRMLLLGLVLAHDLLQAPVPEDLLGQARAVPAVRALAAWVGKQMFRDTDGPAPAPGGALFHLRARERLWDGLRYTLSLALQPTVADWAPLRVPASFSSFYYLSRPVRLAIKYGRLAVRRVSRCVRNQPEG